LCEFETARRNKPSALSTARTGLWSGTLTSLGGEENAAPPAIKITHTNEKAIVFGRTLTTQGFINLSLGISSHSEDHRENAMRSGKQSEIGRSVRPKGFTR